VPRVVLTCCHDVCASARASSLCAAFHDVSLWVCVCVCVCVCVLVLVLVSRMSVGVVDDVCIVAS